MTRCLAPASLAPASLAPASRAWLVALSLLARTVLAHDPLSAPSPTAGDEPGALRAVRGAIHARSGDVIDHVAVSNPSGPCITVMPAASDVTIRDSRIGPCGVSARDDYGVMIGAEATRIRVEHNVIFGVSTGVKADRAVSPIRVERNVFFGIRGPLWSGQAVQFNGVHGGSESSRISCNVSDAWYGDLPKSYEDHISLFDTHGTPDAPVIVAGNRVRGGTSNTGGGITVGDNGGEWIVVRDNTVVTVANSGIGVAGGSHIRIVGNRVDNRGASPQSRTHIAFYVRGLSACQDIEVTGNRGIARLWIWGETDGRIDPGFRAGTGKEACVGAYVHDNIFGDQGLSPLLFDQVPETCSAEP